MSVSIREINIHGFSWMKELYVDGCVFVKLPLKVWSEYISGYFKKDIFEKYLSDYQTDAVEDQKHPFTAVSEKKSDNFEDIKNALQAEMDNYLVCNGYVFKKGVEK